MNRQGHKLNFLNTVSMYKSPNSVKTSWLHGART